MVCVAHFLYQGSMLLCHPGESLSCHAKFLQLWSFFFQRVSNAALVFDFLVQFYFRWWVQRRKINPEILGSVFSLCCRAGIDAALVKADFVFAGAPTIENKIEQKNSKHAELTGDGPKVTEPNLRFPAVFCDNLQFSEVFCVLQMLEFPGKGVNLRKSAFWARSVTLVPSP